MQFQLSREKLREKKNESKTIERASDYFKLVYNSSKAKTTSHRLQVSTMWSSRRKHKTFINMYSEAFQWYAYAQFLEWQMKF